MATNQIQIEPENNMIQSAAESHNSATLADLKVKFEQSLKELNGKYLNSASFTLHRNEKPCEDQNYPTGFFFHFFFVLKRSERSERRDP